MTELDATTALPKPKRRWHQFSLRTLLIFVTLFSVFCAGVAFIVERVDQARYRRVPDPNPLWAIDESKPWSIELGRGSGIDMVTVHSDGTTVLYRTNLTIANMVHEKATLHLSAQAISEILAAAKGNGLLGLYKEYHARNIADGTQWTLRIKQGINDKSVYFDNYFPWSISDFAGSLDAVLTERGQDSAQWTPVP